MCALPDMLSTTTVVGQRCLLSAKRLDVPIASQPNPRKSLNERKYPPHDASHQSMFCESKSPLEVC